MLFNQKAIKFLHVLSSIIPNAIVCIVGVVEMPSFLNSVPEKIIFPNITQNSIVLQNILIKAKNRQNH